MQSPKSDTPTPRPPRPQGRVAHQRIPIQQEGNVLWELVGGGDAWFVERIAPSGVERFSYDAFEASEDGQRLANSLNVALARTPKS